MTCKKCGSNNVNVQMVSEINRKKKKRGILYWVLGGWIIELLLWIFLTLPMLIIKIFKPKKYESKVTKQAVCQACGNSWTI